jgi:hypothetical protein
MRTKKLTLGITLLAACNFAVAENKTAVTAVENIKLNGVTVPLNIKTLAEIQRLQEEQAMREELQTAMKASGKVSLASPVAAAKPVATPSPQVRTTATPTRAKAVQAVKPNTLLGVYGTSGAMTAEIQTGSANVRTLRVGEQLGKFSVRRINTNGLELVANNGNTQYVTVGEQVRF